MEYEGSFKSSDGLDFYERRWEPDTAARANVVLIHGYGEHCNRYGYVAKAFNEAGLCVHSYDQRGFGHSPGRRAYIHDFDVLLADLDTYLAHLQPRLEGKPWFLMGHSMGGLVLASYAETRAVNARGLIFSSPFLAFPDDVPKVLLSLAKILGTLTPWLPVGGVDNSGLSRDPEAVHAADIDPLSYHGKVLARTGAQFQAAISRAHARSSSVTAPALMNHGECDKVVANAGTRRFHECCGSQDKTLKIYAGGYHELWNDVDKDAVLADITHWITARL